MEQRTDEWFRARAGKITASRMCDVLAFDPGGGVFKSGPRKGQERPARSLQAREDYMGDIVAELLMGEPKQQVRARALDWGNDVEEAARAAYAAETGELVTESGFVIHPSCPYLGCSPDGLIGDDGMVQFKCPANPTVHIRTLVNGMPEEHVPQIQTELMVTGRQWSDFVSFDPRMPPQDRLYRQRIVRDNAYIETLASVAALLWSEVQDYIQIINRRAA